MRGVPALAAVALLLTVATPVATAAEPVRPANAAGPLGDERLSNETTLSRFAHAIYKAKIRQSPSEGSKAIGRLRYQTEDKLPETYPVLYSKRAEGKTWIQIRVPGRPNGRKGWVPEGTLSELHVVRHQLTIDLSSFTATLRKNGKRIFTTRVGHGAPGTPTPTGRYIIRERLKAMGGSYGPWAFGTSAYSAGLTDWPGGGVIGIHGTNEPGKIPGRPSHGCVRVPNAKISRLAKIMPVGTPLLIRK
jgi:lipoprotein-anchoring transpeptidase ErfK/SrfK